MLPDPADEAFLVPPPKRLIKEDMPVNVTPSVDFANKNENIQSFAGSNTREKP